MSTLLSVSIAMLAGLLMTRIGKKLSLPAVTAYLVAGVLIGPYCLGALHIDGVGFTSSAGSPWCPRWRWALSPSPSATSSA